MDATDLEQDNRREFLRRWVAAKGGQAEVARQFRLTPSQASYLSQILGGYSFGARSARGWEKRLGMPPRMLELPPPELGVAQVLSHIARDTPPPVVWGEIKNMDSLPTEFEVELPDDAMAPKAPAGTKVRFRRASTPAIGEGASVPRTCAPERAQR